MMNPRVKKAIGPYLFILPCFFLIVLILLYPLGSGIVASFYNTNLLTPIPPRFVGLENFAKLLKDPLFRLSFVNSVIWTVTIVAVQTLIGLVIALLLNQDIKGRRIFRSIILIPWVIPAAIGAIAWKWIYAEQYGLLNYLLYRLGVIETYQPWLADPSLALWAVIVVAIWKGIPFAAIVLLAGLQSIPQTLYEAARVDGANRRQVFMYITLPQLKNIAMILLLLTSIWTFNHFETIDIITRGGPGNATHTLPIYTYRLFLQSFQISYASSVAVIMLIPMLILAYFYIRSLLRTDEAR